MNARWLKALAFVAAAGATAAVVSKSRRGGLSPASETGPVEERVAPLRDQGTAPEAVSAEEPGTAALLAAAAPPEASPTVETAAPEPLPVEPRLEAPAAEEPVAVPFPAVESMPEAIPAGGMSAAQPLPAAARPQAAPTAEPGATPPRDAAKAPARPWYLPAAPEAAPARPWYLPAGSEAAPAQEGDAPRAPLREQSDAETPAVAPEPVRSPADEVLGVAAREAAILFAYGAADELASEGERVVVLAVSGVRVAELEQDRAVVIVPLELSHRGQGLVPHTRSATLRVSLNRTVEGWQVSEHCWE